MTWEPPKSNVLDAADETLPGKTAGDVSSPYRSHEFPRGTNIGRHILLDKIGEGGTGIVYAAFDSDLDRKVAVKFLSPERATLRKMRLLREAQAMARLQHPNVVAVYQVGTFEGHLYLVMEFVDGVDLNGWLAEKRRTSSEVLEVFRAAGRGLAAAHAAGIIHRDFKPGNVLVDRQDRARVTDFGLARARRRTDDADDREEDDAQLEREANGDVEVDLLALSLLDTSLTQTGEVRGTPSYMSPEHHSDRLTDERSDQFSFCVALYEALYREHPFQGGNSTELVNNLLCGRVNSPPAESSVPHWCRKVLLRGLRGEARERYPSMDALMAALARPVRAGRLRIGLAAASSLGVASIASGFLLGSGPDEDRCTGGRAELAAVWNSDGAAGLYASFAATGRPHAPSSAAGVVKRLDAYTGEWVAMHRATCQATARGEQSADLLDRRMACLSRRLSQVEALVELFVRSADADVVDKAIDIAARLEPLSQCAGSASLLGAIAPPADPAKRARIAELQRAIDRADAEREAGRLQIAMSGARAVIEAERGTDYTLLAAQAGRVLSRSLMDLGRFAEAHEALVRALSLAERAGDGRLAAHVLIHMVVLAGQREKRFSEAQLIGRMVEARLEHQALRGDRDLRATLLVALGLVALEEERFDRAVELDREALAIRRSTLASDEPVVAFAENALGNALRAKASYEEAGAHLNEALAIWRRTAGDRHPHTATAHIGLGVLYWAERRQMEARRHLLAAVAILRQMPEHTNYAVALSNLGTVEFSLGNLDAARSHLETVLALRLRTRGHDHADTANTLHNLGEVLRHTPEIERALELHRRALAIREKTLGKDHPRFASTLAEIGEDLRLLGRPSESLAYQERSRAILQARLGESHAYVGPGLAYQGLALADQNRSREAIPVLEHALELLSYTEPNRARVALALAEALEPRGPRSPRALVLSLEALATFTVIRAKREIDRAVAYMARGNIPNTRPVNRRSATARRAGRARSPDR